VKILEPRLPFPVEESGKSPFADRRSRKKLLGVEITKYPSGSTKIFISYNSSAETIGGVRIIPDVIAVPITEIPWNTCRRLVCLSFKNKFVIGLDDGTVITGSIKNELTFIARSRKRKPIEGLNIIEVIKRIDKALSFAFLYVENANKPQTLLSMIQSKFLFHNQSYLSPFE
jgi:hypothetical protein